ncbi:MAG: RNA ligase, Rnl2 family [Saprospiraceae bacterium]|nr:RNA ligase, Rnl2 family [Saprospiraceae bacterium]
MFKKYNSIENTYREEFLRRIQAAGFWREEYIVQEKVHGANLSYWTRDGEQFFAAKRTSQIGEEETFHNYDLILKELEPSFKNIWQDLKAKIENLEQLTIFGEIIGGDYPHPDIEPDKKAIVVQKGVYYSPSNRFYAFDIMVNTTTYLDVDMVNAYFEQENMLHAKTLFRGIIQDCMAYPNDFESTIPKELGLPELKPNIVEGTIIRPSKSSFFKNGTRLILKNKNERWSENKKYHKTIKRDEPLPEKLLKLQEAILGYVTENRLNNVLSKIGEVSHKDFGRILGMFSKDVIKDFFKDFGEAVDDLDKKELKLVKRSFSKAATSMVNAKLFGA